MCKVRKPGAFAPRPTLTCLKIAAAGNVGRDSIHTSRLVETHRPKAPNSFNGERTSHIYAEATNNTRHWASRETTSSGTRMIDDLSHEACSSRPLSRLSPLFAATV